MDVTIEILLIAIFSLILPACLKNPFIVSGAYLNKLKEPICVDRIFYRVYNLPI